MEAAGPFCKLRPLCSREELAPLLDHLRSNRPVPDRIEFERGTLLGDGRLDLCKQALGADGARLVAAALADNTRVRHLLLGADQLGPEGAIAVADLVRDHDSIETLYLGCNGLGPFGARAVADALCDNDRVRGLWLKRNVIGPQGAHELARMLRENRGLQTLDLVSNELGIEGVRAVAEALRTHPALENLYVCDNGLGPEGAAIVAELMRVNRNLRRIFIATNAIGDAGACELAAAIPDSLVALGMSSNDIGPRGAEAVAAAVTGHPNLQLLELGYAPATKTVGALPNRIAACGARAFVSVLRAPSALQELDLSGNELGDTDAAPLLDALEENRRVTKLIVGGGLSKSQRTRLVGLLCRNSNAHPRVTEPHLASVRSVYRTARPVREVVRRESRPKPSFSEAERGFSDDELAVCEKVLGAIADRRDVLAAHPELEQLMIRILRRGKQRPERTEEARAQRRRRDRELIEATGIRRGDVSLAAPPSEPSVLSRARKCYICKTPFSRLHHFYDLLCPACADVNWRKRNATADLSGRLALVTGGRIKIGREIVLKLLRAGARVIATTRFPHDAAKRYAAEPDFASFADRLEVRGLDLLQLARVERFAEELQEREDELHILINNAAQTIRRPREFYASLRTLEATPWGDLPADYRLVLAEPASSGVRAPVLPSVLQRSADDRLFPIETDDGHGQPLDLRSENSWRHRLHEVTTPELLEVHLVNAIGPFVLLSRLRELLGRSSGRKLVVNVSAMEGVFSRHFKSVFHPHTNMAKAAMNMMTRTSASDLMADGIYMASVDTGWITDENPYPRAQAMERHGFAPPLDEVDGAARVLDPVLRAANGEAVPAGCLLKDYAPIDW